MSWLLVRNRIIRLYPKCTNQNQHFKRVQRYSVHVLVPWSSSFLHLLLLNLWRLFCFSCLSCLGSLVKPQTDNCQNSSFERCFPKPYSLSRLEGKRREGVSRKGGWRNSGKKKKHEKRKRGRLGLTYTLPYIK